MLRFYAYMHIALYRYKILKKNSFSMDKMDKISVTLKNVTV